MKKKDTLTLILTESQYYDPNMQDLIKRVDKVEVITGKEYQNYIEEEDSEVIYN